jgi:hypothetical protein
MRLRRVQPEHGGSATVTAGPADLFTELAAVTAPPPAAKAPGNGGNGAAAPPGVTVENREIGPVDVVTLSSGDAGALTKWLRQNGFSADVVYPMRLSAMADDPEQVRVYTLAPHRLTLTSANPGKTANWAARLADLHAYPDLAKVAGIGTAYLTRFDGRLLASSITDAFHFSRAASGATIGQTADRTSDARGGQDAGGDHSAQDIALGLLAVAAVAGLLGGAIVWQRRQRESG